MRGGHKAKIGSQSMNMLLKFILLFLALQLTIRAETSSADLWQQRSPESQGFSAARLEALRIGLAARNTKGFLVIRNDTIVCEWYAPGQDSNTRFGTASLAQ